HGKAGTAWALRLAEPARVSRLRRVPEEAPLPPRREPPLQWSPARWVRAARAPRAALRRAPGFHRGACMRPPRAEEPVPRAVAQIRRQSESRSIRQALEACRPAPVGRFP